MYNRESRFYQITQPRFLLHDLAYKSDVVIQSLCLLRKFWGNKV